MVSKKGQRFDPYPIWLTRQKLSAIDTRQLLIYPSNESAISLATKPQSLQLPSVDQSLLCVREKLGGDSNAGGSSDEQEHLQKRHPNAIQASHNIASSSFYLILQLV
mmetsp:Transcript_29881/g.71805  ORF Transcript_29881/g.71805 Transcript_29881/m.71805 type:complete len:107 (+) Transcript_29881:276-596(+)